MSNGRPWKADEKAKLARLNAMGRSDGEIAHELPGRNRQAVRRQRIAMDLERGQSAACTAMMARINTRRKAMRARV